VDGLVGKIVELKGVGCEGPKTIDKVENLAAKARMG